MKKIKIKFSYIIAVLFIMFSCIYLMSYNGYYEYTLHNKTILNNQMILEFERDIESGKNIDLKKYYREDKKYSNKFTNSVNSLSNSITNISRKVMKKVFKVLNNYFSD